MTARKGFGFKCKCQNTDTHLDLAEKRHIPPHKKNATYSYFVNRDETEAYRGQILMLTGH